MDASRESEPAGSRVLGLGNEILADDAFGILAAREVGRLFPAHAAVACSSAAGFALLDDLIGARRLVIIDTILTGAAKPGTIHVVTSDQVRAAPGVAPHFLGIFEVLAAARRLDAAVPEETVVVAVEAADCTTVGGPMHPDVEAAIPAVAAMIGRILEGG